MARAPLTRKIVCAVAGAEVDGAGLLVRYAPVRGHPPEIRDRIPFGPNGEIAVVNGVGRFLRILRAGRLRPPPNPYRLYADLERAVDLVRRCQGCVVQLQVQPRFERLLTVWTDAGVERIAGVIDFHEDPEGLAVRRFGGQSLLRIPRGTLIRYEATTIENLEVVAVEPPPQIELP